MSLSSNYVLAVFLAFVMASGTNLFGAARIELLKFDKNVLDPGIRYVGQIVDGARWRDANGENVLVVTQTGNYPTRTMGLKPGAQDAKLCTYHYILQDGRVTLNQGLADGATGWSGDLHVALIPNSIAVTDLDWDGVAEAIAVYKIACRVLDGPASIRLKLVMHEGKERCIASGSQGFPSRGIKAEMKLDDLLKKADPAVRAHVTKHWKRFAKEEFERF